MISDNYQDSTAEMLNSLGYEASFMENIHGGEEIVIMEKDFEDGETRDVVTFLTVIEGTVKKDHFNYDDNPGCVVRFIARNQEGHTKPMSYGGSWGIYIKEET